MTYQVLARKWRPRSFATLVGQEHVVKALRHALEQKRLHHAYLFTGTRGVGKTTIARILAKCLNCETGITSEPCGTCSACTEIDGGRFPDLIEIDAATNTGIDEMRALQDNAAYVPVRGRFKIFVIDEVHMLSKPAFNSMLKTLEEPPEHIKFILATTDPQKIPVTVLSRCLQFNLKLMPRASITEHLARLLGEEKVVFEREALALLAHAAQGSMRDALSLLDQAIAHGGGEIAAEQVREMLGAVDTTYLLRVLGALDAGDGPRLMAVADELESRSLSFDTALADLASLLLRVALAKAVPEALDADAPDRERLMQFAGRFSAEDLQLYYQIALQGRQDLALAPDEHAGFAMTLLRLLAFRPEGGSEADPAPLARPKASVAATSPGKSGAGVAPPAASAAQVAASAKAVVPAEGPAQAGASGFDGDWPALARRLPLSGAAKQLALNSALAGFEGWVFDLRVAAAMEYLAAYQDKLKAALEHSFGRPVRVKVSVGTVAPEATVAAQEAGARDELQAKAVETVRKDRFVNDLVNMFDATVIDSSIRPRQQG
ncbi:MAG: DNA polymerase III subunit gamma/tau [Betaproteobacteria bacterium]|nr:DNA polymerase III subunit gamma/tau [Betaproteobacteria bacterium]